MALRDLPVVHAPQLSPDGGYVIYSVRETVINRNNFRSITYIINLNTGIRTTLANDISNVQWAPSGNMVSYFASRYGKSGLFVAPITLGDQPEIGPETFLGAIRQSDHFLGHQTKKNYSWSPNSDLIAYVSADIQDCNYRRNVNDPVEIERTMYKTRTALSDNCLTRIWVTDLDENVQILTPGNYDSHSLSWSPDGRYISFLSNHTDNPDHNYNNDLFRVELESGKIEQLTATVGTEHEPQWAPRGDRIAFSATIRPTNTKDSPAENTKIYVWEQGQVQSLTQALDRRATNPVWHPDGQWLYFSARNEGKNTLYRVRSGSVPEIVLDKNGMVNNVCVGKNHLVYLFQYPGQPAELYQCELDGSNIKRLTYETETWVRDHSFSKIRSYWFTTFDGTRVQGFLATPASHNGSDLLPVIHRIHGGPHGMYGYSFSDLNELLTAEGYAVVFINPRGSTGYGQKFADGTYQAWGGGDYKDLMIGLDSALAAYPFLDEDRMGVTGGSYGGFMTNWIVTQTNRYDAAVTVASVSNLISFYGTSLYQLLIETEFNGLPWENYIFLLHFSPFAHVQNNTTPTLI
ncbi:MAG: S9 family peptidase, partial [Saprospiraceae bacterium]|nr:S9 family peptidase [Saprospiraceae bacterium]